MHVETARDAAAWDSFLGRQRFRPFLQSWAMGEVYTKVGQEPIRVRVQDGDRTVGICFAHVVPARRGKHLAVPYGPVLDKQLTTGNWQLAFFKLTDALKEVAIRHQCSFIRMSPFWPNDVTYHMSHATYPSPLHLLAEHIWYLPLQEPDPWESHSPHQPHPFAGAVSEEDLFMNLRKTTRNLVRRAEKEGVTVEASKDPIRDLPLFIALHEETRRRHGFTPYTNAFFHAQVEEFHKIGGCTLYRARHAGNVVATSIHMHVFGETSYHHGASTQTFGNVPASYLLQWTAIRDALKRGDHIYNFWGIAPEGAVRHPFAGVTTFKTGFGGKLLELTRCMDIPLSKTYYITRGFEILRKWRRGF